MSAPDAVPARLFRQIAVAAEFAAVFHPDRPGDAATAATIIREDLDAACRAMGTGTGAVPAGELVPGADAPRPVAADAATLAGRARLIADLLDVVGGDVAYSVDITSSDTYTGPADRVRPQARLHCATPDAVRAAAARLGAAPEVQPWEHGPAAKNRHIGFTVTWRNLVVEVWNLFQEAEAAEGPPR